MSYQRLISTSLRTITITLPCLVGGCGIYLHDGDLETKTAKVLETYNQADIPTAMQAAVDNQKKLDAADIDALVALDAANREYAAGPDDRSGAKSAGRRQPSASAS